MSDPTHPAIPSVETTLGALALASNESSWPTNAQAMLDGIESVDPTLQPVLTSLAKGLMEAHLNLMAMFLATRYYMNQADPAMKEAIRQMKLATAEESVDVLRERFAVIGNVHEHVEEVFRADLSGSHAARTSQAELAETIRAALARPADAVPA